MIAARYIQGPLDGEHDEVPDDCRTIAVVGTPGGLYVRLDEKLLWIPIETPSCPWRKQNAGRSERN